MSILLVFTSIIVAVLLSFSDKIIEHFSPDGDLAQIEHEVDEVMNNL